MLSWFSVEYVQFFFRFYINNIKLRRIFCDILSIQIKLVDIFFFFCEKFDYYYIKRKLR